MKKIGSISTALSCLVYPRGRPERGLISRTAAGNRAYEKNGLKGTEKSLSKQAKNELVRSYDL